MTQMTVQVFEIGGQYMIDGGDISEFVVDGTWENGLDSAPGTSTAIVTFAAGCFDDRLLLIHPYLHELRISLDGDIVFEGPIRYFSAPISKGAVIVADDFSAWFGLRFVYDQFDYSTGVTVSDFIRTIVTSCLKGGPAWAGQIPEPNLLPYITIDTIPDTIKRQNGSLVQCIDPTVAITPHTFVTYAQGARPLTDPHEIAWDAYLSYLVGNLCHMSVQGRRIHFWPYGNSLGTLPPADVSNFTDFPNLTRNGDMFCTHAAVQVQQASLTAFSGAAADTQISVGEGPGIASAFYPGQQISSDSALVMPIGTEYVAFTTSTIAGPPTRYFYYIYSDTLLQTAIGQGSQIRGDVFGQAGGKHPTWPVRVDRARSEPNVVGRDQAQQIAASMIETEAPYDTLDIGEFKAIVSQHEPWDFTSLVPGQTTLVTTPLGGIVLQVTHVGGSWQSAGTVPKLELYVGLRTLPAAKFVPAPYVSFTSNNVAPVAGDVITVHPNFGAHRRRRIVGDQDDMAIPLYVNAPGLPDAFFFPPNTFLAFQNSADRDAFLAAYTGAAHGTVTLTPAGYNLLILACQTGVGS